MRAKPEGLRFTSQVPRRVDECGRWMVRYLEANHLLIESELSTLLGAAEVILRTDLKTGLMNEPTQQEKDLAKFLIDTAIRKGYKRDEVVAALVGAADGVSLLVVRERIGFDLPSVPSEMLAQGRFQPAPQVRAPGAVPPSRQ